MMLVSFGERVLCHMKQKKRTVHVHLMKPVSYANITSHIGQGQTIVDLPR